MSFNERYQEIPGLPLRDINLVELLREYEADEVTLKVGEKDEFTFQGYHAEDLDRLRSGRPILFVTSDAYSRCSEKYYSQKDIKELDDLIRNEVIDLCQGIDAWNLLLKKFKTAPSFKNGFQVSNSSFFSFEIEKGNNYNITRVTSLRKKPIGIKDRFLEKVGLIKPKYFRF
ncbi:MAG: hypothetical protein KKA62_06240 [Nanoarchaeota archaeon]|nr:hypothetical protein [Nanoarchaeota archaeon]MBU1644171.1 hypothetical protein [Nanoarchaeota archaeon]MBU1977524.1 hypothetical protein [Nanoarchaeota archaeon]